MEPQINRIPKSIFIVTLSFTTTTILLTSSLNFAIASRERQIGTANNPPIRSNQLHNFYSKRIGQKSPLVDTKQSKFGHQFEQSANSVVSAAPRIKLNNTWKPQAQSIDSLEASSSQQQTFSECALILQRTYIKNGNDIR